MRHQMLGTIPGSASYCFHHFKAIKRKYGVLILPSMEANNIDGREAGSGRNCFRK